MRTLSALPYTATVPNGRISFGVPTNTVHADVWPSGVPSSDVKWKITGTLTCPTTGSYQFVTSHAQWIEVRIDGTLVYSNYIENYDNTYETTQQWATTLSSGSHTIDVRCVRTLTGNAGVAIAWKKPGDGSFAVIPTGNYSGLTMTWGYNRAWGTGSSSAFTAAMNDTETVLRGPGLSSSDQIFIGLDTLSSGSADAYNLRIQGAVGYSAAQSSATQPGYDVSSSSKGMFLWNQPMKYWFIASGRRFIVIAKVSTTYQSLYGGFILPYGLPSEFPYPLAIGGSATALQSARWSVTSTEHASFWAPQSSFGQGGHLSLRENTGVYRQFQNFSSSNSGQGAIYPWCQNSSTDFSLNVRPSPSGDYGLIAATLMTMYGGLDPNNVWGELDGVFILPGQGNASENIITIASQDYLVVQSGFRTTNIDYAAIKLA